MPKITIEFNNQADELLKDLPNRNNLAQIEVIRDALALYRYLDDETRQDSNRKVAILDAKDQILKEIAFKYR